MSGIGVFKKFVVPGTLIGTAVVVAGASANDLSQERSLVRPSELPIYASDGSACKPQQSVVGDPSALETQIGVLRKEVWVWHDKYKGLRKEVVDVCETGLAKYEVSLHYLRQESNYLPRYGAVALTGLAGLVLGLRGGKLKKLVYSTGGMLAMAGVLYPAQGAQVLQQVGQETKRGVKIAYNFVYGVKPDYLTLPDPATFLPDVGADVKPPSDGAVTSSFLDTVKTSFLELTGQAETPAKPAGEASSRDQSHPADKSLYTTRQ